MTLRDLAAEFEFADDAFLAERGGTSTLLLASCAQCGTDIFLYQKDGPGPLLRCYFDRIHHDSTLAVHERQAFCRRCGLPLGRSGLYRDSRHAIFLYPDRIRTQSIKSM